MKRPGEGRLDELGEARPERLGLVLPILIADRGALSPTPLRQQTHSLYEELFCRFVNSL